MIFFKRSKMSVYVIIKINFYRHRAFDCMSTFSGNTPDLILHLKYLLKCGKLNKMCSFFLKDKDNSHFVT